jgi:hypothetical protein
MTLLGVAFVVGRVRREVVFDPVQGSQRLALLDAAILFRLAVEKAPAGKPIHGRCLRYRRARPSGFADEQTHWISGVGRR